MKLLRLTLSNFKGVKQFILQANGHDAQIYGDNATGKTTLYDAFLWLLFDKDSANKKDFAIKTLDKNGEPIHGLEHSVSGTFYINNDRLDLTKVYSEQWTKKRGSATKEFTGHTTDYFINSVPVKKNEYTAKVAEIINEDIFRLLTNPLFFNEQLHWEKRRAILLEVCGDLTDEEVIASDKKLADLPKILGNHSLEDYRKIIASKRTKINDELKKIPVRIDEVTQGMPNIEAIDDKGIDAEIELLNKKISAKREELAGIENGGEIAKLRTQIKEIEGQLLDLKNNHRNQVDELVAGKREEYRITQKKCEELTDKINGLERKKKANLGDIYDLEAKMASLRSKWIAVDAQQFTFEQAEICPACGQSLPADQLTEARDKAQAEFNRTKSSQLEAITNDGKQAKQACETLKAENEKLIKEIETLNTELGQKESEATGIAFEIESLLKNAGDVTQDQAYISKTLDIETIKQEIAVLQMDATEATEKVNTDITDLTLRMRALEETKASLVEHERCQNRIAELSEQERDLAAEYEKLEGELYLTEEFVKAKVSLLEEKINSKFKLARFKLFDTQVNGGIAECCETTYNGVPYSSGLNNGHRIAVGIDIISTLSEHYGFYAPIFIDNCEAITRIPETKSQLIRLYVSEKDKALRVENQEHINLFREVI